MCSEHERQVLISLGMTKGGKRHGAAESVILGHEPAVRLVKHWKSLTTGAAPVTPSPYVWRKLFNDALDALKLSQHGFRPYSLRRGGATFWFGKHHSLDKILVDGRWHTQKSARIYLNEGLSILAKMSFPKSDRNLRPYLHIFSLFVNNPNFKTLEPPTKVGRKGVVGRKAKRDSKKRGKTLISPVLFQLAVQSFLHYRY